MTAYEAIKNTGRSLSWLCKQYGFKYPSFYAWAQYNAGSIDSRIAYGSAVAEVVGWEIYQKTIQAETLIAKTFETVPERSEK